MVYGTSNNYYLILKKGTHQLSFGTFLNSAKEATIIKVLAAEATTIKPFIELEDTGVDVDVDMGVAVK